MSSTVVSVVREKEEELIHTLEDDFLQFSSKLSTARVIPKKALDIFSTLDHKWLDSRISVRFLLHFIYQEIGKSDEVLKGFLQALAHVGGKASHISRNLSQQLNVLTVGSQEDLVSAEVDDNVAWLVFDDILAAKHIPRLMVGLVDAYAVNKWEEIGIALGIPMAELKKYEKGDNEDNLYMVLQAWVNGKYECAVPATLKHLKLALVNPLVQLSAIAMSLYLLMKEFLKPVIQAQFMTSSHVVIDGRSTLLEILRGSSSQFITYQWLKDGLALSDGESYVGVNNNILAIVNASHFNQGIYTCKLSEGDDVWHSQAIELAVISPPMKNHLITFYSRFNESPQDSRLLTSIGYVSLTVVKKSQHINGSYSTVKGSIEGTTKKQALVRDDDIFMEYRRGKILLLKGRPGSGKTTLAFRVAREWAIRGNYLKNAKMVFFISLKAFKGEGKLLDILDHIYGNKKELEVVINDIVESGGEGICFILDGLDMYFPTGETNSDISRLLKKTFLPNAMIIVTSRPVAKDRLKCDTGDDYLEVVGFTRQHIFDYIEKYPFDVGFQRAEIRTSLCSYLYLHPNILNICYLPLHIAIVCHLVQHEKCLPVTETKLLSNVIQFILFQSLCKQGPHVEIQKISNVSEKLKDYFSSICHLAFKMTFESKQVVVSKELGLDISLSDENSCGLLVIESCIGMCGLEIQYSFLHLCLQEYLAAYHLASLPKDDQVELLSKHGYKAHMRTTWKYYCGIVNFEGQVHFLQKFIQHCNHIQMYLFQCAFESQQAAFCKAVARLNHEIKLWGKVTALDIKIVFYVLSFITEPLFSLHVGSCHINFNGIMSLANGLKNIKSIHTLDFSNNTNIWPTGTEALNIALKENQSIHTLKFSSCGISSSDINDLLQGLEQNNRIQVLDFSMNNIHTEDTIIYADMLWRTKYLQTLNLSHNSIGLNGAAVLADVLAESCIQELDLSWNDLGSYGVMALANGLKKNGIIQSLKLSHNNIGYSGAKALAEVFMNGSNIHLLDLSVNYIGSVGMKAFSPVLKKTKTMQTLLLSQNGLNFNGAAELANGLASNQSIKVLDLSWNTWGSDGLVALAHGLKMIKTLEILSLSHCRIGYIGILAIAESLINSHTIKELDLSWNGITYDSVAVIADIMKNNKTIRILNLSHNEIDPVDTKILIDGLIQNTCIQKVDLSWNSIDTDGMVILNDCNLLHYCCNIQELDLSMNNIGLQGVIALSNILKNITVLRKLKFSRNNIGSYGIALLIDGLLYNYGIQELDLSWNSIGSEGARLLADTLKKNETIQRLSLSGNTITTHGAIALASLIEVNSNIIDLDLSWNCIGANGAVALAEGLMKTQSIKILNLSHNIIGLKGTANVVDKLNQYTFIQALDLSCNKNDLKYGVLIDSDMEYDQMGYFSGLNDQLAVFEQGDRDRNQTEVASDMSADDVVTPQIKGFSTIGETSFTYYGKPVVFNWEGYGLQVFFDSADFSNEIMKVFHFFAAVNGNFQLPENSELVSGAYYIKSPPDCILPITTVKISHCVAKERIKDLSFAVSSNKLPPYYFNLLKGGYFTSSYGEIEVKNFSVLLLVYEHGISGLLSLFEKTYLALLYRSSRPILSSSDETIWDFYLIFIKKCPIFQRCVSKFCEERKIIERANLSFRFSENSSSIDLDILPQEDKIQEGWFISPVTYPSIKKGDIDSFVKDLPPHLRLILKMSNSNPVSQLQYKLIFRGAGEPNNFIWWFQPKKMGKFDVDGCTLFLEFQGTYVGESAEKENYL